MQQQLRDGLILRSLSEGYETDRERLPKFYAEVFGEHDDVTAWMTDPWTEDLMRGHPTVTLDDIFVVVDPSQGDRIVSATLLIPQVWRYEDIPFTVGRPELVATHKDYRRRGLVRALFEAVHARSAALHHQVYAITGIPHYYRQFGYTMAVELGQHATIPTGMIEKPEEAHFTLRPAVESDIPDLIAWTAYYARTRLLSVVRSADEWRYELGGRRDGNPWDLPHLIIVNTEGEGVGYVAMRPKTYFNLITCMGYVVGEKSSYFETFADVSYAMKQWGTERFGECPPVMDFADGLHETLSIIIDRHAGGALRRRLYAWYLRVPNLPGFMWHIAPVLERRLRGSGAHGYTGELRIGFYDKTGLTLRFEKGCLAEATQGALDERDADVSYPDHLFLNVLFGYHTYDELRAILPEVGAKTKAAVLLDILFPKKRSWIMGLA